MNMKTTIRLLFFGLVFTLVSVDMLAQQDREREERERQREKNIPAKHDPVEKYIEIIVGTWEPTNGDGGQSQSTGGDLVENNTLVFNRENQYVIMNAEQQQLDSGSWRMNEAHSVIYMESADGSAPRPYNVNITGDELTLQPPPSAAANQERTRHVYRRREQ